MILVRGLGIDSLSVKLIEVYLVAHSTSWLGSLKIRLDLVEENFSDSLETFLTLSFLPPCRFRGRVFREPEILRVKYEVHDKSFPVVSQLRLR